MAWTSPMTAIANEVFTAAQYNQHIRDNLLETAPALATTAGAHFVSVAANQLVERVSASATVATSETTTSTTFTDLATVGPEVTVNTGTMAFVVIGCALGNAVGATGDAMMTYAISGTTTVAASDNSEVARLIGDRNNFRYRASRASMVTGLTPGDNTFTAKYRSLNVAETATFLERHIAVIPF
ncbi:hypothetical protein [Streptomyces sp. NPDC002855]|uniref:hypothetical protein n=1 Tax=Streptomyces sp. NPDC002855 TaxID=3154437 RepID=UPI003330C01F